MRGAIQLLLLCTSAPAAAKQPRHVVFVVIDEYVRVRRAVHPLRSAQCAPRQR